MALDRLIFPNLYSWNTLEIFFQFCLWIIFILRSIILHISTFKVSKDLSFLFQSLKFKIEEENRCNQEIENYLRAHQEVRACNSTVVHYMSR